MNRQNEDALSANDRYRRVIENIDHLPSLPSIIARLLKVVNSPDTSAEDAAELIEKDPALTSKMIRLANSAFYGIPRSISSVSSAVVILGFNTIRSLVLSASVMKLFTSTKHAFDKDRFWKHSIVTAMAAKAIVRHFMSVKMMDPESAFCAGILHDIGKLIFNEYAHEDYKAACELARSGNMSLLDAENQALGTNHAAIGKILADKWALPLDLEYSLVYHHDPSQTDQILDLVATVHCADQLAHKAGAGLWENEQVNPEWSECRDILKINDSDHARIYESLSESVEKANEFLSIIR